MYVIIVIIIVAMLVFIGMSLRIELIEKCVNMTYAVCVR